METGSLEETQRAKNWDLHRLHNVKPQQTTTRTFCTTQTGSSVKGFTNKLKEHIPFKMSIIK